MIFCAYSSLLFLRLNSRLLTLIVQLSWYILDHRHRHEEGTSNKIHIGVVLVVRLVIVSSLTFFPSLFYSVLFVYFTFTLPLQSTVSVFCLCLSLPLFFFNFFFCSPDAQSFFEIRDLR